MKHILLEYCEKLNNLENAITDYELIFKQKLLPYINEKLILDDKNHWIYISPKDYKFLNKIKGLYSHIKFKIYVFNECPIDHANLLHLIKSKNYIKYSYKKLNEIVNIIINAQEIKNIPLC